MAKNKNYIYLVIAFSVLHSNQSAIGAIISALTRPYGYTVTDTAWFGSLFVIGGIIGSFSAGYLLDRYRKFRFSIILIAVVSIGLYLLAFWSLPSGNAYFFALNLGVIGFFAVPILPISYTFAVELTYPTPEPVSNGMMLLPTKIFGALLAVAAGHLCSIDP